MLRKTMIVLTAAGALTWGLTADAVALATAHTGWDGLGDASLTTPGKATKLHKPANGTARGRSRIIWHAWPMSPR